MKRSEINAIIKRMEDLLDEFKWTLPPFFSWTAEEWETKGHEFDEIRDNKLGWDVTDYGLGKYDEVGIALVTIRNGSAKEPEKYPKPYAEKLIMIEPGQLSPMHFHWNKMEDIINRGGGDLIFKLYNATEDGEFADTPVVVLKDGARYEVEPGTKVTLKPGESLTLYPYLYHDFTVDPDDRSVLIGEVSMCNDDDSDNRFEEELGRFPVIEEDEPPYRLLCTEYPRAK